MEEKNLPLERLVFFSDAVIAIAITLLALDLKIEHTATDHLQFSDLLERWRTFGAFLLSFFIIANFWKVHNLFFTYIKSVDDWLMWGNSLWLLFIVTLPFTTSLVSAYFSDTPAIFLYSLNMFLITVFQNVIWDYATYKGRLVNEIDPQMLSRVRVYCNMDMANALLAVALSFVNPMIAFVLLLTKLPMVLLTWLYYVRPVRRSEVPRGNVPHGNAPRGNAGRGFGGGRHDHPTDQAD